MEKKITITKEVGLFNPITYTVRIDGVIYKVFYKKDEAEEYFDSLVDSKCMNSSIVIKEATIYVEGN